MRGRMSGSSGRAGCPGLWPDVRAEVVQLRVRSVTGAGCPGFRAGCPGVTGCPGSGSVDELDELRVEEANSGQIREILWMEIGEKMGES